MEISQTWWRKICPEYPYSLILFLGWRNEIELIDIAYLNNKSLYAKNDQFYLDCIAEQIWAEKEYFT